MAKTPPKLDGTELEVARVYQRMANARAVFHDLKSQEQCQVWSWFLKRQEAQLSRIANRLSDAGEIVTKEGPNLTSHRKAEG